MKPSLLGSTTATGSSSGSGSSSTSSSNNSGRSSDVAFCPGATWMWPETPPGLCYTAIENGHLQLIYLCQVGIFHGHVCLLHGSLNGFTTILQVFFGSLWLFQKHQELKDTKKDRASSAWEATLQAGIALVMHVELKQTACDRGKMYGLNVHV